MLRTILIAGVVAVLGVVSLGLLVASADFGTLQLVADEVPLGSVVHVHGSGFVNFSNITNQLDISIYPIENGSITIERGSVAASRDGNIDFTLDTGDGNYAPGTYGILASYTYFGARRNPYTGVIDCGFCPIQTLPLADPISFTLD